MKRVLLMLVAMAAFACMPAFAQAGGGAGGGSGAGAAGAGGHGSTAGNGNTAGSGAQGNVSPAGQTGSAADMDQGTSGKKHHKGSANGKSGKMSTLTGCLSSSPDSNGMYTLSNGRYKNGVEVGPTDKVQAHAGHQVALKGNWNTGANAGENAGVAASTGNSNMTKNFNVDSVKHISDTCKEAPGGGTMGHKGHGKKKGAENGATSGATTTPPPTL